ncbi:MAG: hypothetical protein HYY06_27590 [Deltaproteobacteria bacterium]|nr:hypothetical protein [Deltaproteobacteria bacterium]
MVKQLGDFLARIARRKEDGEYEEALDEIDAAWDELLGRDAELFRSLDPATLTGLCRHREKAKAVARLCCEEADVCALQGDIAGARLFYERARAIYSRSLEDYPAREDDSETVAAIVEIDRGLAGITP